MFSIRQCRPLRVSGAVSWMLNQRLSTSVTRAASGSLFGDVTQSSEPAPAPVETPKGDLAPKDDVELQKYYMKEAQEKQWTSEKYINPLKRRLFDLNMQQHGFFKNNQIVRDPESGKAYKVSLTAEEVDILEPTVYVESYRIKSSMKKATVVNRFVRGVGVLNAINQLHFNPKKMATELERMLKRGLEQARTRGLAEDDLYIQALWTGSDGKWVKRADIKGRGRTGKLEHPYVHLKAILKTGATKRRLAWEKEQERLASKPRLFLNNEPLNFKVRGAYKW